MERFKNSIKSLKECSYDDAKKEFVTDLQDKVYSFDDIKVTYCKDLKKIAKSPSKTPLSSDVLFQKEDEWYFIEYKNTDCSQPKFKYNIRRKMYDSLLLFMDLQSKTIGYTRDHLNFILVYSDDEEVLRRSKLDKNEIQDSTSRDQINDLLGKPAKQEDKLYSAHIGFGLESFQHIYFKEVCTVPKHEFKRFYEDLINN